jgi:outer membrane protein W
VVAPPPAFIRAHFGSAEQQQPPQGERPLPPEERPHQIGIGSAITATTQGLGGATRYFFNDRLGIDFVASWYNPRTRNTTGSVFNVTPSVVYMLKLPNDLASIDIRPYVGGGLSYVRSSYRQAGTIYTGDDSGLGGQVFGGAELTFQDAQFVTISFEGRYYRLPTQTVNVNMIDGFNFMMMFHFYVR